MTDGERKRPTDVGKNARRLAQVCSLPSFHSAACMRVHADDDDADDDGDVVLIMKVRFPAFWQAATVRCATFERGVFTCMRSVRACVA